MDWGDYGQVKGYHILDLEKNDLKFIPNEEIMFHKIQYNGKPPAEIPEIKGRYVKVLVSAKEDQAAFQKFIDELSTMEPEHLQIIDTSIVVDTSDSSVNTGKNTIDVIGDFVEEVEASESAKASAKRILTQVYEQALKVE